MQLCALSQSLVAGVLEDFDVERPTAKSVPARHWTRAQLSRRWLVDIWPRCLGYLDVHLDLEMGSLWAVEFTDCASLWERWQTC